jgi:hypothetical protein
MYRRFYLLINLSNPPLAFWTVPAAQSTCVTQAIPTSAPTTSKWGLFTFVCLVAQLCQSCNNDEEVDSDKEEADSTGEEDE